MGCPLLFAGTRRVKTSAGSWGTGAPADERQPWALRGRVHTRSALPGTAPPPGGRGRAAALLVRSVLRWSGRSAGHAAWTGGEPRSAHCHSLRLQKKNSPKDFAAVVGPRRAIHLLILSKTGNNVYFNPMHLPESPTLTLQINKYALVGDVSSLQWHHMCGQLFTHRLSWCSTASAPTACTWSSWPPCARRGSPPSACTNIAFSSATTPLPGVGFPPS